MRWKTFGIIGIVLLLTACGSGMPAGLVESTLTPTAAALPTATAEPQRSGLQVVIFYSPL